MSLLLDIGEHPAIMSAPVFEPPGSIPLTPGVIQVRGGSDVWVKQVAGPPIGEVLPRILTERAYDYVGLRLAYQPIQFARAVAKVAYGLAVLQLGLDAIEETYVLPAIMGDTAALAKWVGCDRGDPILPTTGLHAFQLTTQGDQVHVFVRLFAQFEAPEYHVIVGRLRAPESLGHHPYAPARGTGTGK